MKKGFTLIELLITMVLVAVLATVALTKYTAALERGRAVQAIAILRDISDAANAQYVLNDNQYPNANQIEYDTIRKKGFSEPEIGIDKDGTLFVHIDRDDKSYRLVAHSIGGDLASISCMVLPNSDEAADFCATLGFTPTAAGYLLK